MKILSKIKNLDNFGVYENGKLYFFDSEGNAYEFTNFRFGPFLLYFYKKESPNSEKIIEFKKYKRGGKNDKTFWTL